MIQLLPRPESVASTMRAAAGNVAHALLYGGLADLRPMPRTLIDEGTLRELYHYRPTPGGPRIPAGSDPGADPVLLVTPLAAPALCYDLRRDCSLIEHLVDGGRPTYLVEYGQVSFRDRELGMEHWVEDVIPAAIENVSEHAGGRPVHLVGWSLGGIFAALVAASRSDLPIASLTLLGSPFDLTKVPMLAPVKPLIDLGGGHLITQGYRLLGGAPQPIVRWAFQLSSVDKLVTKPLAIATHLDDTEFLAQIEAVDRFTAAMTAYPGRSFGQLYHRLVRTNEFATGRIEVGERSVALADLAVPTLVFAGADDGIAPLDAVRAVVPLLEGAPEVRLEVVPGGHLGMLTGRAARRATWPVLDAWFDEWSPSPASG